MSVKRPFPRNNSSTEESAKRRRLSCDAEIISIEERTEQIDQRIELAILSQRFELVRKKIAGCEEPDTYEITNDEITVDNFTIIITVSGRSIDIEEEIYVPSLAVFLEVQTRDTHLQREQSRKPFFKFDVELDADNTKVPASVETTFHDVDSGAWGFNQILPLKDCVSNVKLTFDVSIFVPVQDSTEQFVSNVIGPVEILEQMFENKICADITIVCTKDTTPPPNENTDPATATASDEMDTDSREIACHKNVLCTASPVFQAMLSSEFVESTQGRIEIDDFSDEIIRVMVRYLYLGDRALPDAMGSHTFAWEQLFAIAIKYQMETLAQKVVGKMMTIVRTMCERSRTVHSGVLRESKVGTVKSEPASGSAMLPHVRSAIHKTNCCFYLVGILNQYEDLKWLQEMETSIVKVVLPVMKTLYKAKDIRCKELPHGVLMKLVFSA